MRRKHWKITRELPPELVEAVNEKLVQGYTYQQIASWLKEMGHEVSRSAVGRYSKDFLARLERLKLVRDQARAIIEDASGDPQTAMAEAASQLAFQLIMEAMMAAGDRGPAGLDRKIVEAMKALAQLERSGVAREKLKAEFRQKAEAAASGLRDEELAGKTPEEIREIIRRRIREEYGA